MLGATPFARIHGAAACNPVFFSGVVLAK